MVAHQIERRGIKDPRILEAMRNVPRHLFVDEAVRTKG
jgi:protein-L-isoaspartate(D-aspartate) O-methyltransferase